MLTIVTKLSLTVYFIFIFKSLVYWYPICLNSSGLRSIFWGIASRPLQTKVSDIYQIFSEGVYPEGLTKNEMTTLAIDPFTIGKLFTKNWKKTLISLIFTFSTLMYSFLSIWLFVFLALSEHLMLSGLTDSFVV